MPNCPGAKLSGAKLSWCQIVLVPNCPLLLSWCHIVCFYYLGAKLSALLSWCQIVRCQIVRCQIVLQSDNLVILFTISFWRLAPCPRSCLTKVCRVSQKKLLLEFSRFLDYDWSALVQIITFSIFTRTRRDNYSILFAVYCTCIKHNVIFFSISRRHNIQFSVI